MSGAGWRDASTATPLCWPFEIYPFVCMLGHLQAEGHLWGKSRQGVLDHGGAAGSTLSRLDPIVGEVGKFPLSNRSECTAGHRVAAFACEACGAEVMVPTSCGRLEEPTSCTGCGKNWTMKLLHNRCLFLNRQLIKMQVRPLRICSHSPRWLSLCEAVLPQQYAKSPLIDHKEGCRWSSFWGMLRSSSLWSAVTSSRATSAGKPQCYSRGRDSACGEHECL